MPNSSNISPFHGPQEEIIEELEAGCDYLPGSYKDSCKEFVKEYGVEFWTYLVDSTSAEEVCTMFGLCSQVSVYRVDL